MARKSVNFNVSEGTYNRVKSLFPDVVGTEDNLLQLLNSYEWYNEHKNDAPADDQISELQAQIRTLTADKEALLAECDKHEAAATGAQAETDQQIADLREQITTLEEQNLSLAAVISERETTISELEAKQPTWAQIRLTLQPFTVALLEETARRLSERYGKQVTPMAILTDMFLRYTIERWSEWFYKFILNDREILSIAQKINPDIKSIDQIKKAVLK